MAVKQREKSLVSGQVAKSYEQWFRWQRGRAGPMKAAIGDQGGSCKEHEEFEPMILAGGLQS